MTLPPDPPPNVVTMRTIGWVWVVVGGLAVLGGAVATVFAIVLFGILAVVLGAGLIGIQQVRAESAERASRTLAGAPDPPVAPPPTTPAAPPPGPGPESEGEADVGPTNDDAASASSSGDGAGDGSGDGSASGGGSSDGAREGGADGGDPVVVEQESSISEEDDGTGSPGDGARGSRHDPS